MFVKFVNRIYSHSNVCMCVYQNIFTPILCMCIVYMCMYGHSAVHILLQL